MNKEEKANTKGNKFDLTILRRLLSFTKPYKLQFSLLIIVTLIYSVLSPILPIVVSKTISGPIKDGNVQQLLNYTLFMVSIVFIQVFLQFSNTYLSGWLGQYVIRDIRVKLYDHILKLKLKEYDNTPIGRLVTRVVSDIETLSDVFSQGIAQVVAEILQLVAILSVMFYWNWQLTLISLSSLPILLFATYIFKEKMKSAFDEVRTAVASLNTFVQEHITGMSIVQIFSAEDREQKKFETINEEHRRSNLKTVKYYSIYFPVAEVIGAVSIGLLVWWGARGIIGKWVEEPSVLIAFIMYINMFFRPIRMIADRFNTIQLGILSTERIIRLLDSSEKIENNGELNPANCEGNINFRNVNFSYIDGSPVIRNLSFEIKQGEIVAFVGATGAGKSSIINLLGRYYEIDSGEILLDDINIKSFDLYALRKKIGVVLQDVFLFSTSVRENITLGNDSITDDLIWDVAQKLGAKDFLERLPSGLDFVIQERGGNLSVGQRQILSFIRAMVYNPDILILDEATSSVDTESEIVIQLAIEKMMKGRTSIVIAHRLSTIQKSNKIIVLDKGQIVEQGDHQELLLLKGHYHHLYQMQYKDVKN